MASISLRSLLGRGSGTESGGSPRSRPRLRRRLLLSAVSSVALIAGLAPAGPALADNVGAVTEYPLANDMGLTVRGQDIVTGPDQFLWFTGQHCTGNFVNCTGILGRMTRTGQQVTLFTLPTETDPTGITVANGKLWFVESTTDRIATADASATPLAGFHEYADTITGGSNLGMLDITTGQDGNLWFTETSGNKVGQMDTTGAMVSVVPLASGADPSGIAVGPPGSNTVWVAESDTNKVAKIPTPSGTPVSEYSLPTSSLCATRAAQDSQDNDGANNLVAGPNGLMWFTEYTRNCIGSVSTGGTFQEFAIPTLQVGPDDIASAADGNLWFTEYDGNSIGRMTPQGGFTEFPLNQPAMAGARARAKPAGRSHPGEAPEGRKLQARRSSAPQAGTAFAEPFHLTIGPDGNVWFTEDNRSAIGKVTVTATPTVTAITPQSGPLAGGTAITITGTNFCTVTGVTFNGVAATGVTRVNDTTVTATSPAAVSSGPVDVQVTGCNGQTSAANPPADTFTYGAAPTVTGVMPNAGAVGGGTRVLITGTNFCGTPTVLFDTTPATNVTLVNPTTIAAVSPAHLTGRVDITVTACGGTSATVTADQFTYGGGVPTVSSVSPSSGPIGGHTQVIVTGTNFCGTPTVNFGANAATGVKLVDDTTLLAVSPASVTGGSVDVTVQACGGTSAANPPNDSFTYGAMPTPVEEAIVGPDGSFYARKDLATYTLLGGAGTLVAAPAVVSVPDASGVAQGDPLFIGTAPDHQLVVRSLHQTWQHLSSSITYCVDNPAGVVTSSPAGFLLTVGCQGSDNALWYAQVPVTAGTLPPTSITFHSLGGVLAAGPAVAAVGPFPQATNDELTFFVTGTDGHVWTRTPNAGGWSRTPWLCLGHPAASTVLTSALISGQMTVFACHGTDNALWFSLNDGSGWQTAHTLGGSLADGPAVATAPDRATVFIKGNDGSAAYQSLTYAGVGSGSWTSEATQTAYGPGAAALLTRYAGP